MTFRGTWISNPTPWPRPEETWVWRQVDKIGKDTLPFNQDDYPNPVPPYRIEQTWLVNHTPFLGKDKFYGGSGFAPDFDYPNPQPVQWYRDWSQSFVLTHQVVQRPLNQYDWPNPGQFSRIDQTWVSNLAGALKAPFNQRDWPNSQPSQWYRDWQESGNSLGTPGVPINQDDWPNPKPVSWYQDWNNTLVLNMPVFMPSSVSGWGIPPSITWYQNWTQCLLQNVLAPTPVAIPFNQYQWTTPYPVQWYQDWKQSPRVPAVPSPFAQGDWPNPTQPSKLDQFWAWNQTRYQGQDRLPNRQQDWPIPYPVQWYQDYKVNLLQTTLFTTPALPNIRQYDWPLPRAYEPLVPSWTYTSQFIVPAPIPLVTIGGQYTEEDADALTEAYARAMEFALKLRQGTPLSINEAAAALAKRGGDARAKSLSPSQRTKIASNAASIRWKK